MVVLIQFVACVVDLPDDVLASFTHGFPWNWKEIIAKQLVTCTIYSAILVLEIFVVLILLLFCEKIIFCIFLVF